jgi:hypothetical protein
MDKEAMEEFNSAESMNHEWPIRRVVGNLIRRVKLQ